MGPSAPWCSDAPPENDSERRKSGSSARWVHCGPAASAHASKSEGCPRTWAIAWSWLDPPTTRPRGHEWTRPAVPACGVVRYAQS